MLRIDIQSAPPIVKLFCSGRIVLGVESETLRCMATSRPERSIIVDLRQVQAMDAAGLGLLVELYCRAQQRAGAFAVVNPSPWVRRLLALTNLDCVFRLAGSGAQQAADGACDAGRRRAVTA